MSRTDHHLLYGILALQMDFIDQEALIKAMHLWALEKSKSLSEILQEQGSLGEEEGALLDALVQKHLEKHNNDAQQSLIALGSMQTAQAVLAVVPDPEVQESLQQLASQQDATGPGTTVDHHFTPGSENRFHILRPHARGGLGQVSVAYDGELNRDVALKELQDHHAVDADKRARFLLEAEVTGRLEHPGIVPVYSLGAYADGRPFYAMRFIKGESLREAIQSFHNKEGNRPSGERSLAFRELLGRFVDVCHAMEYAHSRGVIHRDLKPANVMVGQYGETLVVDWGLAKVLDQPGSASLDDDLPFHPAPRSEHGETQLGSAIGTPAYMSPEQAAGRIDLLGPASDVYSLGATLYSLLTGMAPFSGNDPGEILRKVQQGDFQRPRRAHDEVPRGLEAICQKAMARNPEDRYASARDLGEDIQRWLADESVLAYREPVLHRMARWQRQHKALVAGFGALLVTTVIALSITTAIVSHQKGLEARARQTAEKAKGYAEQQKNRADGKAIEAKTQAAIANANALKAREQTALAERRLLEVRQRLYASNLSEVSLLAERDPEEALQTIQDPLRFPLDLRDWTWELMASQSSRRRFEVSGNLHRAILSRNGRYLVTIQAGKAPEVQLREMAQGRLLRRWSYPGSALGATFTSNDRQVVLFTSEKKLYRWHIETGQAMPALTLEKPEGPLIGWAFSHNGELLATVGLKGRPLLWSVATGKLRPELPLTAPSAPGFRGSKPPSIPLFFDHTDRFLIMGVNRNDYSPNAPLRAWDLTTGKEKLHLVRERAKSGERRYEPGFPNIDSAFVTEDSKSLIVLGNHPYSRSISYDKDDGELIVINLETGKEAASHFRHKQAVIGAVPSPDGKHLLVTYLDGLMSWNLKEQKVEPVPYPALKSYVAVASSLKEKLVITGGILDQGSIRLGRVKVWDWQSGQELATLEVSSLVKIRRGGARAITPVALSAEGDLLITPGELPQQLVGWNLTKQSNVLHVGGIDQVRDLHFSPTGETLAMVLADRAAVMESGTGRLRITLNHDRVGGMAFTHGDPSRIVLLSTRSRVGIYDTTGRRLKARQSIGAILAYAVSPNGKWLATSHQAYEPRPGEQSQPQGARVRLWSLPDLQERQSIPMEPGEATALAFSPDDAILAIGTGSGPVHLWDIESGKAQKTLTGHSLAVRALAFSPNGSILASGGLDYSIRLWDLKEGALSHVLTEHTDAVYALDFSPNGSTLASGSADRSVKLWSPHTGQLLFHFREHRYPILCLEFSKDGHRLAAGGGRAGDGAGEIVIWKAKVNRQERVTFPRRSGAEARMAQFEPGSKDPILWIVDQSGQLRRWDASVAAELSSESVSKDNPEQWLLTRDHRLLSLSTKWAEEEPQRLIPLIQVKDGKTEQVLAELKLHRKKFLKRARPSRAAAFPLVAQAPEGRSWAVADVVPETRAPSPRSTVRAVVWDVQNRKTQRSVPISGMVRKVLVSQRPPTLITVTRPLRALTRTPWGLQMWDLSNGEKRAAFELYPDDSGLFVLSPDEKWLAFLNGERKPRIVIVDMATAKVKHSIPTTSRLQAAAFRFSPDGSHFAMTNARRQLEVRRTSTGKTVQAFSHPSRSFRPNNWDFLPGNEGIITASREKVQTWDMKTGKLKATLLEHKKEPGAPSLSQVNFHASKDGSTLVISYHSGLVFWDLKAGKEKGRVRYKFRTSFLPQVSFTPNGKILIARGRREVVLWDPQTAKKIRALSGHSGPVTASAVSADSGWLATAGADWKIRVYELATGKLHRELTHGKMPEVLGLQFSPDGRHLISRHSTEARVWSLEKGQILLARSPLFLPAQPGAFVSEGREAVVVARVISTPTRTVQKGSFALFDAIGNEKHCIKDYPTRITAMAFSPDGKALVTGGANGTLQIWDAETGEDQGTLESDPTSIRMLLFSPDGKRMASLSPEGAIVLWDMETRKKERALSISSGAMSTCAFSPDGEWLAVSSESAIHLWKVSTGEKIATFHGHRSRVTSLSFSSDSTLLASMSSRGVVKLWQTAQEKPAPPKKEDSEHTDRTGRPTTPLAFSPDGKWLARGRVDGTIALWNPETKEERVLEGKHDGAVFCLLFMADGKKLISGGEDKAIRIHDCETGKELRALEGHRLPVRCLALSPDGRVLASGSAASWDLTRRLQPGAIHLWHLETGELRGAIRDHEGGVWSVAFSPNGKELATASDDAIVRIWDVEKRRLRFRRELFQGPVWWCGYSPDGGQLIAGGFESSINAGNVKQWNVEQDYAGTGNKQAQLHEGAQGHAAWVSLSSNGVGRLIATGEHGAYLHEKKQMNIPFRLGGELSQAQCAVMAPNGKGVAVSGIHGCAHYWDLNRFSLPELLTAEPGNTITTLSGSSKDLLIVGSGKPGLTFSIRDAKGLRRALSVKTKKDVIPPDNAHSMPWRSAFSRNGNLAAISRLDGSVKVHDLGAQKIRLEIPALKPPPRESGIQIPRTGGATAFPDQSLALSPDGKYLALLRPYRQGLVKALEEMNKPWIFDLESGKKIGELNGFDHRGGAMAFSPDGKVIAGQGQENTIRFWSSKTLKEIHRVSSTVRLRSEPFTSMAYSPDGRYLLFLSSGTSFGHLQLWDARGYKSLITKTVRGAKYSAVFGPDSEAIVLSGWDYYKGSFVGFYDVPDLRHRRTIQLSARSGSHAIPLELTALGGRYAIGYQGQEALSVHAWELTARTVLPPVQPGQKRRVISRMAKVIGEPLATLVAPRRNYVVSSRSDSPNEAFLWSVSFANFAVRRSAPVVLKGHTGRVRHAAFSPNGNTVVTGSEDHTIRSWGLPTGKLSHLLKGHKAPITWLECSNNRLVSGDSQGEIRLWDLTAGKELKLFPLEKKPVLEAHLSSDGKQLVSVNEAGDVSHWEVETGKKLPVPPGLMPSTTAVFSPDGQWLACGAKYGSIQMVDLAANKVASVLKGTEPLRRIAISPNSRRLLAADRKGIYRLWDLSTGKELEKYDFEGERPVCRFSASGTSSLILTQSKGEPAMAPWSGVKVFDGNYGKPDFVLK